MQNYATEEGSDWAVWPYKFYYLTRDNLQLYSCFDCSNIHTFSTEGNKLCQPIH